MHRFSIRFSAPAWLGVEAAREVREIFAKGMWDRIVREVGWIPEQQPFIHIDVEDHPAPGKISIKVSGRTNLQFAVDAPPVDSSQMLDVSTFRREGGITHAYTYHPLYESEWDDDYSWQGNEDAVTWRKGDPVI